LLAAALLPALPLTPPAARLELLWSLYDPRGLSIKQLAGAAAAVGAGRVALALCVVPVLRVLLALLGAPHPGRVQVIGFGVYIWNVSQTCELLRLLGQLSPRSAAVSADCQAGGHEREVMMYGLSEGGGAGAGEILHGCCDAARRPIAPVRVLWKPDSDIKGLPQGNDRVLWMFIHPAAAQELHAAAVHFVRTLSLHISCADLRGEMARFQVRSGNITCQEFQPVGVCECNVILCLCFLPLANVLR
jgi:hypothetical protein